MWNCYPWDAEAYGHTIKEHEALARTCRKSFADLQALDVNNDDSSDDSDAGHLAELEHERAMNKALQDKLRNMENQVADLKRQLAAGIF